MSEENVEAIQAAFAAFNAGDWDAALDRADDEIEWRFHGSLALDAEQRIRGREAVRMLWTDFFGVWDEYRMETAELIEAPDGRIVAEVRFTARGHGSGVPIEMDQFYVCDVRDGEIAAIDLYDAKRAAVQAVGLSE